MTWGAHDVQMSAATLFTGDGTRLPFGSSKQAVLVTRCISVNTAYGRCLRCAYYRLCCLSFYAVLSRCATLAYHYRVDIMQYLQTTS